MYKYVRQSGNVDAMVTQLAGSGLTTPQVKAAVKQETADLNEGRRGSKQTVTKRSNL